MPTNTISFSKRSNGWNSFHDFEPDWMIGMNSSLYTWKEGDLYEHHSNTTMNEYYEVEYDSTVKTIFNDNPNESKMFKTICIEGDIAWDVTVIADNTFSGSIASTSFKEKEGAFYGYIRRLAGDIDPSLLSMQGVGEVLGLAGTILTMQNSFTNVSVGDNIYILNGDVFNIVGEVQSYTATTITVDALTNTPFATDFIVAAKNSVAESYGARGGYMEVELTTASATKVELFSISSDIFKSYP
jgi:hypothetical protein